MNFMRLFLFFCSVITIEVCKANIDTTLSAYYDNYHNKKTYIPSEFNLLPLKRYKGSTLRVNNLVSAVRITSDSEFYIFLCNQGLLNGWNQEQIMSDSIYTKDLGWVIISKKKIENMTDSFISMQPEIYLLGEVLSNEHFHSILIQDRVVNNRYTSENVYIINYTNELKVLSITEVAWKFIGEDSFEFICKISNNGRKFVVREKKDIKPVVAYMLFFDNEGKVKLFRSRIDSVWK